MLSILLIHNQDDFISAFSVALKEVFPDSRITGTSEIEGLNRSITEKTDIAIISVSFGYTGIGDILSVLRSDAGYIPAVLLTDEKSDISFSGDGIENGIDGIITWPSNFFSIKTVIRTAIRSYGLKAGTCGYMQDGLDSYEDIFVLNKRHKDIFENTGNAIIIYRPIDEGNDFVFSAINRAAEKIENVNREDLIGRKVTEVFPSIIEFGLFDVLKRVWKTGNPEKHPVSFYKDSRISGWRENSVSRLSSNEIVTIYSDETKHKIAEQALVESEERFRQLAENIQEVFWVVSSDWQQMHYISPAYESVWGRSCNSLYENPMSWTESIIDEDKDAVLSYLGEKTGGDLSEINFPEFRIIHADWSIRWISSRGYPVYDEDGKVFRIVGVAEDITEKKQSERTFNAILEGTAWAIGQDFFDRIVKELTLWLDCEVALIGKIVDDSSIETVSIIKDGKLLPEYTYPLEGTPCMNVIENGYAYHPVRLKHIFPDISNIHNMDVNGFIGIRLLDKEGKAIGILAAMSKKRLILPSRAEDAMKILAARTSSEIERTNIEEKKKQVEVLLQQAQKMEAIGTLAGGIAHDFNNILQSIILNSELAQFENSDNPMVERRTEEVLKASRRATDLVKQILTFSRQSELELRPLKISLVIKEALKMLRSSLPSTIEIVTDVYKDDDLVLADPTQIHQVAMNLCTNASHAMRETGGTLTVSLQPVELDSGFSGLYPELKPGAYLILKVSDTGHGMDDTTMGRIFDPFFTTKKRDEGTGLGLAVVYGIIKELKGAIRVESEKNRGTVFSILLPRIERPVRSDAVEARPVPGGSETMLLIDDEEGLLKAQRKIFERLGYDVEIRSSSVEALEAFKSNPQRYDIVITDQTMPKLTGAQLAKEFIALRPDIPIILCTGFSDVITEEEAKSIGIKEFIMKPIVISEIACKVREVLGQK